MGIEHSGPCRARTPSGRGPRCAACKKTGNEIARLTRPSRAGQYVRPPADEVDEVVIQRLMDGRSVAATFLERREAAVRLRTAGTTWEQVTARTGVARATIEILMKG